MVVAHGVLKELPTVYRISLALVENQSTDVIDHKITILQYTHKHFSVHIPNAHVYMYSIQKRAGVMAIVFYTKQYYSAQKLTIIM